MSQPSPPPSSKRQGEKGDADEFELQSEPKTQIHQNSLQSAVDKVTEAAAALDDMNPSENMVTYEDMMSFSAACSKIAGHLMASAVEP